VRAQLSERAMSIGQSLQQVTAEQQGTTRLELNGEPLALNSRSTKLSVTEVLDRFAEQCAQHSGGADAELEQLATKRPKLAASLDWRRLGVFRTGGDQQAAAGCFADTGTAGLRGLATRLAEVLETGDFSRLGQLRYVHARRSQGGDSTHVITVWTEGQLKLEQMFPAQGDAPGRDIVDDVRPPQSVRVISAEAAGNGFRTAIYDSASTPAEVIASYDASLKQKGYVSQSPALMDELTAVPARIYILDESQQLVVTAQPHGARTIVSAYQLGSNGYVRLPQ
jgi:hypothetical protein